MSVRDLRSYIEAATNNLHDANIVFKKTPTRYKYVEVTQLALKIDDLYIRLRALQIEARLVHRQVLVREGKNPDIAAP